MTDENVTVQPEVNEGVAATAPVESVESGESNPFDNVPQENNESAIDNAETTEYKGDIDPKWLDDRLHRERKKVQRKTADLYEQKLQASNAQLQELQNALSQAYQPTPASIPASPGQPNGASTEEQVMAVLQNIAIQNQQQQFAIQQNKLATGFDNQVNELDNQHPGAKAVIASAIQNQALTPAMGQSILASPNGAKILYELAKYNPTELARIRSLPIVEQMRETTLLESKWQQRQGNSTSTSTPRPLSPLTGENAESVTPKVGSQQSLTLAKQAAARAQGRIK